MPCKGKGTCCMFIGVKNQQSKSCHSCMLHTFLTWYMSLPKIIKSSQTVWEIWPAQDFGIRRDNNGESESTLEHDMPTGPYLCLYQILSKYFKPHTQGFSLEIHSGEVTRKQPQQRLSLLHVTHLLFDTNASTKYYQNMSKGIKAMERKILASGEITT